MTTERCLVMALVAWFLCPLTAAVAAEPAIELPLERTAYFVGEIVPLAIAGANENEEVTLQAVHADGRTILYQGRPAALWLDTSALAPGDYVLELDGKSLVKRFTLTSVLRPSAASLQDEATPNQKSSSDEIEQVLRETGLTAAVALAASDMGRAGSLDAMARRGTLLLVNPDTRPTSFIPARNAPEELASMSQRIILTAQANGRYPNFGGFCIGWDTTGFALGGRKMLLVYWGWGDKAQPLRNYIERIDQHVVEEFRRRTGMEPVTEQEYLGYLAAINRAEFGTAIDLPTKLWLEEIGRHSKPLPANQLAEIERRLDAWSGFMMNQYRETYGVLAGNLRRVDPSLRNTASVQVDHSSVREGQYFPSAYQPLDFQYQSTWNDQVGGPDYVYQWLFTASLLDMAARHGSQPHDRPTWISTSLASAHDRAHYPGKFARVAGHGLAYGQSGIGFALEGFSNVLGGMNQATQWQNLRDSPMAEDLHSGREFLQRFASLAVEGQGDHGVGILFSKSQYSRQHIMMGYGRASYFVLVALARLGYTPRFVTEEELADSAAQPDLKALIVLGQTFPLSPDAVKGLKAYHEAGGRVLVDGNTTEPLPGSERLGVTIPFAVAGKPHNWSVPNIVAGDNDTLMYERIHREIAPKLAEALGQTGRGVLRSEAGPATKISLLQIDGGRDAKYVVAVNDSYVRSQADWHQVRERLLPTRKVGGESSPAGFVYDLTDERPLGPLGPIDCDLSETTVRVLAVLPRELKSISLSARHDAGRGCLVRAALHDAEGKPFEAVLPLHVELIRPDGKSQGQYYRSTDREGRFAMSVPTAVNVPSGPWAVEVRSQLTGMAVRVPFEVPASSPARAAQPLPDRIVVREKPAIDRVLAGNRSGAVRIPVFDSPQSEVHQRVAQLAIETLSGRGTRVDVWAKPPLADYTLAYELSAQQQQENQRIAAGEAIGQIRRLTVNSNDWFSALSGYRCARPLILFDLAGVKGDNPLAETLGEAGLLWPSVSAAFPGSGGAVVQGVHWAFGSESDVVVIQAVDEAGLAAGARRLADLPDDRLTPPMRRVKEALWRQYHVGGRPVEEPIDIPKTAADAVTVRHAPQPFRIRFGEKRPPRAEQVRPPEPHQYPVHTIPVTLEPKQFVPFAVEDGRYYETSTASVLLADTRFWQAIQVRLDVPQAGRVKFTAAGLFRYSDRAPRSQAQWEGVLALYNKLVPRERRPMEIEIRAGDVLLGRLAPTKTENREVPIETLPSYAREKARSVTEEVVVELTGQIELPAGRRDLLLVHRNIVDGQVEKISLSSP